MNNTLTDKEFKTLAIKCQEGTATEEEIEIFHEAYNLLLKRHTQWDEELMGSEEIAKNKIFVSLKHDVEKMKKQRMRFTLYKYVSAAVLLVALSIGLYFYTQSPEPKVQIVQQVKDIAPGTNKAVLTLANGRKIILTDAQDGELATEAGISITKAKDGQLIYHIKDTDNGAENASIAYNTITTPRGGQYQVVLPDGSKVWLNAVSSLRFPASFKNEKQRKVELTGEGYFEIAKDKTKPFIVISGDQVTEVLGTHFNVSSYAEETDLKTTLLEGSVKISSGKNSVKIKPGQQAVLDKKAGLNVVEVNPAEAVAWVNGNFMFNSQDLGSIMRSVSRWYDVDVRYANDLSDKKFTGAISKYKNVSQVLSMLELTGLVHFKIEGRRIVVMK